jgi:hypothetical protein
MTATEAEVLLGKLGKDGWPRQTYAETDWSIRAPESVASTYVTCLQDEALPVLLHEA